MCKTHSPYKIDECMKTILELLNPILKKNHKTISSCCGHGKYHMTIVIAKITKNGFELYEGFSGIHIPRKKRVYKKDKQGYYYIPEVVEYHRRKKRERTT